MRLDAILAAMHAAQLQRDAAAQAEAHYRLARDEQLRKDVGYFIDFVNVNGVWQLPAA